MSDRVCNPAPYDGRLGRTAGDFLVWRNAQGDPEQAPVIRQSEPGKLIMVLPASRDSEFSKGRSGSALFTDGVRQGMLVSVDERGRGKVYRSDWIDLVLEKNGLNPAAITQSGAPEIIDRTVSYISQFATYHFRFRASYSNVAKVNGSILSECTFMLEYASIDHNVRKSDVRGTGPNACKESDTIPISPLAFFASLADASTMISQWRVISDTEAEVVFSAIPAPTNTSLPPPLTSQNSVYELTITRRPPFASKVRLKTREPATIPGAAPHIKLDVDRVLTYALHKLDGKEIPHLTRATTTLETVDTTTGQRGLVQVVTDERVIDFAFTPPRLAQRERPLPPTMQMLEGAVRTPLLRMSDMLRVATDPRH